MDYTFCSSEDRQMNILALNQTLAGLQCFVQIRRKDKPGQQEQRMWLQTIEEKPDGRLVLHTCEPGDPTIQLRLGQCEQGENVFVTLQEGLDGNRTFSLRDAGWEVVSGINLPLPI